MKHLNIEIEQGDSYLLELVYRDTITGLPKDLTDCSASFVITPVGNQIPFFTLTNESGWLQLGGETGDIKVYIHPSITQDAIWTRASWNLTITDEYNVKLKIVKGFFTINPSESLV